MVLESCHLGKLKEAHANNDKISAVRIGKAYLAGTAKEVWVPDAKTQERRDWFHAHRKAVKRTTQLHARLRSYLSDNGVRLKKHSRLTEVEPVQEQIRQARPWSPRQWQVIEILLMELRHADEQRRHWRSLIAQEVLADPLLVSIVRLCGVREMVAFALGAFIGDIQRFAHPKKLVKYVGLNPAFDDSGEAEWSGGIGGHGHKDLRVPAHRGGASHFALLQNPPGSMGQETLGAQRPAQSGRGSHGPQTDRGGLVFDDGTLDALEEIDERLRIKVGKMISSVGAPALKTLGKTRKVYREEIYDRLKTGRICVLGGRVYVLDSNKTFDPKPKVQRPLSLAEEYGLR